ncbi:MAG TPA: winged helix-turn-helix domain-containing protein, partial [Terriglobales bacterium]|nr:winged helix-turn-helix domain-containing protein [Terriglobales bacterium]
MERPADTTRVWRFGLFEADAADGELRRGGRPVKMREQSFRILIFLLDHAGEIVTREELRGVLWPSDTFVDFDHSLNTAVMKLRDALGDSADTPLYIETLPKRGYRFIAPVSPAADPRSGVGSGLAMPADSITPPPETTGEPSPAALPRVEEPIPVRRAPRTAAILGAIAAGAVIAAAVFLIAWWRTAPATPAVESVTQLSDDGEPKEGKLESDG